VKHSTPAHHAWHRRVQGQLRSAACDHPEWFPRDDKLRAKMIRSLSKRIVGEILACANAPCGPGAAEVEGGPALPREAVGATGQCARPGGGCCKVPAGPGRDRDKTWP